MKKALRKINFIAASVVLLLLQLILTNQVLANERKDNIEEYFLCGGKLEAKTWQLWDTNGRSYIKDLYVNKSLKENKDTYALYDLQALLHNLEAMAARCSRTDRLIQLANDLMPIYEALEPVESNPAEKAWICRGGRVCHSNSKQRNTEVMLVSVQGLGLFSALANDLARSDDLKASTHPFVDKTYQTAKNHLLRWGNDTVRNKWNKFADAKPEDVTNDSSVLFFTDKYLWQISIYANLAGISIARPDLAESVSVRDKKELSDSVSVLLNFFNRRLTVTSEKYKKIGKVKVAMLDSGYWRLYKDNKYAGYSGQKVPAECVLDKKTGQKIAKIKMKSKSVPVVENLGWDLSHSRRLVHALHAMEANRTAMEQWYDLKKSIISEEDLPKAFAAKLITGVWNGDALQPLFYNYWSGANGWYRVAYDNGTGYCNAGYPPFGLTDSFATGGYITWGKYYPVIAQLGRRIYRLSNESDEESRHFVQQYYTGLSVKASANKQLLTDIMFWPSLVEKRN